MATKIVVKIFPDGSSSIDAQGFVGTACSLPVRELALAMTGGDNSGTDTKPKPDFYATNPGTNTNTNGR